MDLNVALPTRIVSLLRGTVAPIFLLGAGASVKSGIPLSAEMVERVGRWGFCNEHGIHQADATVMRTDWFRWLTRHPWYDQSAGPAENYPAVIQKVLQPNTDRKRFFLEILASGVQPSRGYEDFCNLLSRGFVSTVLTTNFDDVLVRQADKHPAISHIEVIQTPNDFTNLSTSPSYPQLIYLHGSVEHYTDQNTIEETKNLNRELIERLVPLLRDHPLVVIGYRGAEPSIVKRLLHDNVRNCENFRHGIYWCVRGQPAEGNIHRHLLELAADLGPNFQFIPIVGFDELLEEIWAHVQSIRLSLDHVVAKQVIGTPSPTTFDLRRLDSTSFESLEEATLRTTLLRFCDTSGIAIPSAVTREWLIECACIANVLDKASEQCTVAGWLLFTVEEKQRVHGAIVNVRFSGDAQWIARTTQAFEGAAPSGATEFTIEVAGNLWRQLDRLTELLGLINRPFRLKGAVAKDVYPYAPLALHEFVTNLLVHRDYSSDEPSRIEISPDAIRFTNPGGIVPPVQRDTRGGSLQAALEKGVRGIKGYRNPAISEFFLVARKMEKEGSGLPDVLKEAATHNNTVSFGPSASNDSFVAEIRVRPEHVDPITETARPKSAGTSLLANMLEIVNWPERVRKLGITVSYAVLAKHAYGHPVPPCFIHGSWLWTFAALEEFAPFKNLLVEEEVHEVPTIELLNDRAFSRGVAQLLSDAMISYVAALGLIPWRERDGTVRVYFPKGTEGARSVTYRGRVREATRAVTKPVVSRTTGHISFWEHKAVAVKPESAGSSWFWTLLPTYTFTVDGEHRFIERERIGGMTTRRASRDYNPSVRHDLAFWSWVLSVGSDTFQIPLDRNGVGPRPSVTTSAAFPLIGTQAMSDVPDDATVYEGLTAEELQDVAQEIESILATEEPNAPTD